ncbi:MAG TPA: hypothetical protein VGG68_06420 [Caulobacteraceae bacterium]|jgi:hypothetical protein
MSFVGLLGVLVVFSAGMGVFAWYASRARREELKRLDEREAELRREGKID